MKKFKLNIEGSQYEVEVANFNGSTAEVVINGNKVVVAVEKEATKTPVIARSQTVQPTDSHKATIKTTHETTGSIKAPIPGTILKVMVNVGDKVTIGQDVIILEAMKMENNIKSDKEGTVKEVKVKSGDSVMESDVLIEVG